MLAHQSGTLRSMLNRVREMYGLAVNSSQQCFIATAQNLVDNLIRGVAVNIRPDPQIRYLAL